jgi:hypothetical protein
LEPPIKLYYTFAELDDTVFLIDADRTDPVVPVLVVVTLDAIGTQVVPIGDLCPSVIFPNEAKSRMRWTLAIFTSQRKTNLQTRTETMRGV